MTQENTDKLNHYLENAVDHALKAGAELIIGKGVNKVENQIRFSESKIDINKAWSNKKIEFMLVVDGNQLVTGEFCTCI